eukprot:CAMPEP_0176087800 /NCGR_PEP_ID=MMETSP0120_2-20121206/43959_1 /TAXON_ID=160619 /ORGANISM="Kryptoperidinium foliaceum, Strain CCMP 1326" /LENGTH=367 /DNA_ID=CAMNT_0017421651 /DNA_START=11 /DNA_END=1115 /DNA_ORIENTATION=+
MDQSRAMLRTIESALESIDYPDKAAVWEFVQQLGRRHQRAFPGYKFVPRGGLSSPHVRFMTDIDFIFSGRGGGLIAVSDFDALEALAVQLCGGIRNIISAKVSLQGNEMFDEEVQDLQVVRSLVAEGADVAVITGRFTLRNGWSVPMDLTLSLGDDKMSKAERLEKIRANLERGDYAKVVQRMRPLLNRDAKAAFAMTQAALCASSLAARLASVHGAGGGEGVSTVIAHPAGAGAGAMVPGRGGGDAATGARGFVCHSKALRRGGWSGHRAEDRCGGPRGVALAPPAALCARAARWGTQAARTVARAVSFDSSDRRRACAEQGVRVAATGFQHQRPRDPHAQPTPGGLRPTENLLGARALGPLSCLS